MTPAADALLDSLFDYAGLFPPASLDLDAATAAYARYRTGPDAQMLGRFIVPAARLAAPASGEDEDSPGDDPPALDAFADRFAGGPWRFSVLGLAPAEGEAWSEAALRTLRTARAFDGRHDGRTTCDRFELRLPAELAADPDALADTLGDLDEAYRNGAGTGPRAALEVPFLESPGTVAPAADALARANGRAGRPAFALKLRCGGVTPDLVPSVEALATALAEVVRAGVPFKATAGLHHPLPNHDDAVGARMHGFLGVFGGAALVRLHGLGADDWAEILDSDDSSEWSATDGLRWRSLRATAAEVADARRQLALSFGTCSFDEPLDDLRQLGWI